MIYVIKVMKDWNQYAHYNESRNSLCKQSLNVIAFHPYQFFKTSKISHSMLSFVNMITFGLTQSSYSSYSISEFSLKQFSLL